MSDGQHITGTRDEVYNLVSVLYHALEGSATYARYIQDAQRAGDQELVQFFQQVQREESQRAERAKLLLGQRVGLAGPIVAT